MSKKKLRKPKAIHLFLHGRPQKIDPIMISVREIKAVRDWLDRWVKYKEQNKESP